MRVGRNGVTPAVVAETKKSLAAHGLIKVRIGAGDSDDRRAAADKLAAESDAHLAAVIGKTAILYRAREEKPRIVLPT